MTTLAWVATAVFALVAAIDWWAVGTGRVTAERVAKPATTIVAVAVALALEPSVPDTTRWAFVVALLLCLAGDVLLLPPRRFVPGLASFLLGHVAFVAGMLALPSEPVWFMAGAVLVMLLAGGVGLRVLTTVKAGPKPDLALPVGLYLLVISVMVMIAWSTARPLLAAGASLFAVSDGVLAWREFVEERPWMRLTVTVTYHAAILLMALSLA